MKQKITITMEGGVIQHISDLPEGVELEVIDIDELEEEENSLKSHVISIGVHLVYNATVEAKGSDAAVEEVENSIKQIGIRDTLDKYDATACPILEAQDAYVQYEWQED